MTEVVSSPEPAVSSESESSRGVFSSSTGLGQGPDVSEPAATTTDASALFTEGDIDWDNVDYTKVDINKLPVHIRPLARQAKKMQASFTRVQTSNRDKERLLDSQLAQMQQMQRMEPQTQQTRNIPPSEVEELQTFLNSYGFTPEATGYQEYALVAKMIRDSSAQDRQLLNQLVQVVTQLNQGQQQVVGHIQQSQVEPYTLQFEHAVSVGHDADEIRSYAKAITPLVDQVLNPATGKLHTIQTAYELLSGKAAGLSQDMIARAATAKANARNRSQVPPNGAGTASNSPLSGSQLRAELGKLFPTGS